MGKFYETCFTFNYSWEQMAGAFWSRYPNPFSSHVLSEDTIFREMRGNQLYSRRLLTKTNRMPRWGERLVKASNVSIVEESYVNPVNRTITTYTRNIGYTRIMSVIEKVTYSPDPKDPQQTIATRSAWIDSNMYGLRRAIEGFGIERFRKNCSQAAQGFNYVLNLLYPPNKDYPSSSLEALGAGKVHQAVATRLEEATQKMKQKALRAGQMAKGSISTVYAASTGPGTDS